MNVQGWFPLGLTSLISLQSKGLSRVFSSNLKAWVLWHSAFLMVQLSHAYMTTRKIIALTIQTFVSKVMPLLFRFVIAFLPSSKHLLILGSSQCPPWFWSTENKVCHSFQFFPSICHEVMGPDTMIFICWIDGKNWKEWQTLFSVLQNHGGHWLEPKIKQN